MPGRNAAEGSSIRCSTERFAQTCDVLQADCRSLQASGHILWDALFVLAVDQTVEAASGCSIDSSVKFMHELGQKFDFNPFDRSVFGYLKDEKLHYAKIDHAADAKGYEVINLSVSTMEEYKSDLLLPFEESAYTKLAIDTSFKFSL